MVVVPTYADSKDEASCPFRSNYASDRVAEGEAKNSWRWFNTVNRVVSGAKKVRQSYYFAR